MKDKCFCCKKEKEGKAIMVDLGSRGKGENKIASVEMRFVCNDCNHL